jgi:hypothetical protein
MLGHELTLSSEVVLDGIFIAKVIDAADPKALERVRVRVIGVHDLENEDKKNSIWASHLCPSKSNSGEIPDVDDFIYVTFLQNNPSHCVWLGWCRTIK